MAQKGDRLVVILDSAELRPPTTIGTLTRWPGRGEHRPISFEYDEAWLEDRDAFPLDPRTLLFGASSRSAPTPFRRPTFARPGASSP